MKYSILVIEDSFDYQIILKKILTSEHDVTVVSTGKEAIEIISHKKFDLFLIDVMLPDMSGLQICNFIKNQRSTKDIPIILVTSKNQIEDKIKGFDIGADDYVTKPFHLEELGARIKARLKTAKNTASDTIEIPGLLIDLNKQSVMDTRNSRYFELTRVEFKLLVCLAQRIDFVLSREVILNEVWPTNLNISERTVDTHISNLRKKLQGVNVKIAAVHGNGYRFSIEKNTKAA